MAKSKSKSARQRTQVKDLSKRNKKLSGKDLKKVEGGLSQPSVVDHTYGGLCGFSSTVNWGDGSQTGFTPPFPANKK